MAIIDLKVNSPKTYRFKQKPTEGEFFQGDIIIKTQPSNIDGILGWVCTSPGNPGTWSELYIDSQREEYGTYEFTSDGTNIISINHNLGTLPSGVYATAGNNATGIANILYVRSFIQSLQIILENPIPTGEQGVVFWNVKK